MPKITKLRSHLLKVFRENSWLLFFLDTVYMQILANYSHIERTY